MRTRLDRNALVERLEPVKYEAEVDDQQAQLEQMSIAGVLLTLAEIHHEREYEMCRGAALHLVGELNEPEDIVLD